MISNVRSYKVLGIGAAYATYIQRFLGRFMDVSLFQEIIEFMDLSHCWSNACSLGK